MNHYIVMQGHTYQEEKDEGIIWCPQKDKSGNIPHSWLRMMKVRAGDQIFHYVKGKIKAVSVALSDWEEAPKPTSMDSYNQWEENGFLVRLYYYEIEKPITIQKYFNELKVLLPVKYSPFQRNGDGNQGYLYPCNEELTIKLMDIISDENFTKLEEPGVEKTLDEERNKLIFLIKETEAEAKRKIRIGQEKFKSALLPLWKHQCALCDIKLPVLIRASHSKPWHECSDEERLNPYNGVLLCCNHDALYDQGYITFDETGLMYISDQIPEEDYAIYNIELNMKISSYEKNKNYFRWHRKYIFR